jgi:hypothetical protein
MSIAFCSKNPLTSVSSKQERIEKAKKDWRDKRFALVPEEIERNPLPADSRPVIVRYP